MIAKSCIVCGRRTPDGATRCPEHAGRRHDLARPCIACARPTRDGDYCAACSSRLEAERQLRRDRSGRRDHYKGSYQARARKVRKRAEDGLELCAECGLGNRRPGDRWSAGHVRDGDPTSPLVATHLDCNIARENRRRSRAR